MHVRAKLQASVSPPQRVALSYGLDRPCRAAAHPRTFRQLATKTADSRAPLADLHGQLCAPLAATASAAACGFEGSAHGPARSYEFGARTENDGSNRP